MSDVIEIEQIEFWYPPNYRSIEWISGETPHLRLLDQTLLPARLEYRDCRTPEDVWDAIKRLQVRGAPAIGIAAAFGVVLGVQAKALSQTHIEFEEVRSIADYLRTSRPTAVNLFWALERMEKRALEFGTKAAILNMALRGTACEMLEEDRSLCIRIGKCGAALIQDGMGILTHCNTGALATAGCGTALGCVFLAMLAGKKCHVYADETRPLLQGSRLTAWELQQWQIPVTLICDSMAAQVMKEGRIQMVIVGADRIAANGDTANKIGTYGVAVLARAHHIPFYVAAPFSTFDLKLPNGDGIPIEQRDPKEVTHGFGKQTAPDGIQVYNPAFDVTPAELITGLISEKGLIQPVNAATIASAPG